MTIGRSLAAPLIAFVVLTSSAHAGNQDRSYFCEAEAAGGISANGNKWRGEVFELPSKFVLKLTYVTTSYRNTWDKKIETIHEYKTLIRPQGSENGATCEINSATNTIVEPDETFKCAFGNFELRFNLKTRRYLQVSFGNFLEGDEQKSNSPYIQRGGCTRID